MEKIKDMVSIHDEEESRRRMDRITSSVMACIAHAETLGLHDDRASLCNCSHVYTDTLLPDSGAEKGPQAKNCWAKG